MIDERRQQYEEDRRTHCNMHEKQMNQLDSSTEKVISLSSSYSTLKYVVGICLPVLVLMLGAFYTSSQSLLQAMAADMKDMKVMLISSQIENGKIMLRLDNVESNVVDINARIDRSHPQR